MTDLNLDSISALVLHWGTTLAMALAMIAGGWIASGWAERAVMAGASKVKAGDSMLGQFFASLARWAVLVFAGLAVLERLGIQTASVIAVLGAAGLAVGLALQGTLSSLAAGVMLLLFRPFRIGDTIEAGGLAGTVKTVSLFQTELVTADNVQVIAPNAQMWGTAIRNISHHTTRHLVMVVPVPYPADMDAAISRIKALLAADQRVMKDPAAAVAIAKFGETRADIEVSVWCAAGDLAALKGDLMAALWRECLKDKA